MKRAIIIGASSGIGREVSKLLLADGWFIGIAARREDRLLEIKSINPCMVEIMPVDVTADDAPGRLLDTIGRLGGVNLFLYSSGVGRQNMRLDVETETHTVDVNVRGFTRMIDTVFNYMADNLGGDIAVISSIAGTKGFTLHRLTVPRKPIRTLIYRLLSSFPTCAVCISVLPTYVRAL